MKNPAGIIVASCMAAATAAACAASAWCESAPEQVIGPAAGGDYELALVAEFAPACLGKAAPADVLVEYERSVCAEDPRADVRTLAGMMRDRIVQTVQHLDEFKGYETRGALLLRSATSWRFLLGDESDPLTIDCWLSGDRVVSSSARREGTRTICIEDPLTYDAMEPVAWLMDARLVDDLLRRAGALAEGVARFKLEDLDVETYHRLRLPFLWNGISKGELVVRRTPDSSSVTVLDSVARNAMERATTYVSGRLAGWTQTTWLPGADKFFERMSVRIDSFKPTAADAPFFHPDHFRRSRVLDRRGTPLRVVEYDGDRMPSDADIDILFRAQNPPRTYGVREWLVAAVGIGLVALGLVLRRRREVAPERAA
jgi:hypothetical protein